MAYYGYGGYQQQPVSRDMDCIIQPVNGKGGLYLGNYKAASNYQYLQQYGIGAVLTAAIEANIHYDHSIIPYHMIVEGHDVEHFDLEDYFDEAVKFTKDSLAVTNTLVHCMAGISRSTTLLIAYLIRYRGMKSDDALQYVRSRRSIVNPNPGFWNQLKQYEKILIKRQGGQKPNTQQNYNQQNYQQNYQQNAGGAYGNNFVQPGQQAFNPFGFGGLY